ncbi:hypothetical protein D3C75_688780 [compost metagenome]
MSNDSVSRPNLDALTMAVRLRRHSFNVDYEGDTLNYTELPKPRLPLGTRLRRKFNNLSLTRKNTVRKVQKRLNETAKRGAAVMHRNMRKLHDK